MHSLDKNIVSDLQKWQGKEEIVEDQITPTQLRAMAATLGLKNTPQSFLPPLWHWLYFLSFAAPEEIGPDGHASKGGFLPPVPLPRRMWAGGRIEWHSPLQIGDKVKRQSSVESITHKVGRTGELYFVKVKHNIFSSDKLCITEEHDIVYRESSRSGNLVASPIKAVSQAEWYRTVSIDEVLLFRYSALTFNCHRIHYDRKYVTEVEGYSGLVVHGPLMATLLTDLVSRHTDRQICRFDFKAIKPILLSDGKKIIHVHGKPTANSAKVELWIEDEDGYVAMQAFAELN